VIEYRRGICNPLPELKTKLNNQAVSYTPGLLASLVSKSEFISAITTSADDDIDSHESDTFASYLSSDLKIDDPLASLHISGDDDLQLRNFVTFSQLSCL
jgi:hypothetical protein